MYFNYVDFCSKNHMTPVNAASFGKVTTLKYTKLSPVHQLARVFLIIDLNTRRVDAKITILTDIVQIPLRLPLLTRPLL